MRKIGMIASEGYRFFVVFLIIGAVFLGAAVYYPCSVEILCYLKYIIGFVFTFIAFFSLAFFRNPKRNVPYNENSIICPADGKIVQITEEDDDYTGEKTNRVSIFMSVFNVHINRIPMNGKVDKIEYFEGKFLNAADNKAPFENERNAVYINGKVKIIVVQIAGLIARRIKCFINKDQEIKQGDYLGLIQFGSRLDVSMPKNVRVNVKLGDKVKAGETVLGEIIK